jgi:beta-fructofuranosidase
LAQPQQKASNDSNDPYRLAYHIMAPTGWINDPNGLIHFNGEYHVFYQYHPYSPVWGPMHWGHVKSQDLVHWEHLPIALVPGETYDSGGCFSGSAVDVDGTLALVYTGNIWLDEEKPSSKQVQCLATSADGITFFKDPANPVLRHAPFEEVSHHFRDPKVWRHGDRWYMVVGTQIEGKGAVLVYSSHDLRQWHYLGVIANNDGALGYMWECPDFFSLDGHDILLFSPQGVNYQDVCQTGYLVGQFDYTTGKLRHGSFEELDKGFDFYAPQTFLDAQGRRILIGWMHMWETPMPTQAYGWAGALTLPRELTCNAQGKLIMKPVPELEALRGKSRHIEACTLSPQQDMEDFKGDCFEMTAVFSIDDACDAAAFGIKVRCSADGQEETVITYDVEQAVVSVDRNRSGKGVSGIRRSPLSATSAHLVKFHVYIDRSSLEVFVNDGEVVFSSRIYPDPASVGNHLFTEGGSVTLLSCDIWELQDIWND